MTSGRLSPRAPLTYGKTSLLRVGAYLLLAACGWMGADGLRRAGAQGPLARVYFPFDADRLPEGASDARLLGLRPVSPFARFRDALQRSDGADGEAFRLAARGLLRWGRNQPVVLLDLGRMALVRWKERGEAADRQVGEALLVEYTRRTTHVEGEGLRIWAEFVGQGGDPFPLFSQVRQELWQGLASVIDRSHPDAAWRLFLPALRDGSLDQRVVPTVSALARARKDPSDLALLESLVTRKDLTPQTIEDLTTTISALKALR